MRRPSLHCERHWPFFGGVPRQIVPDNLKAGVTRADRYEPELNRTYLDLAAHYGTAILPARARKGGEYAIHGTNKPESIGKFASYGCIRMHNEDITDLFARVDVGTQVVVTR